MSQSLIELCLAGKNLPSVKVSELHYSGESAKKLAQMEENHFWFTSRRKVISSWLIRALGINPGIGLEIGCGTGYTAVVFSENGIPTIGLDAHPSFEQYQKSRRGKGFVLGDIFSIEPKAEFDFLLLLDVIEHVEDDVSFLRQAMKFLKPGGVMLISVPAFQSLWSIVDEKAGHLRRYTKKELEQRIQMIPDAKVEKRAYFYGVTLPLYWISRIMRKSKTGEISSDEVNPGKAINRILKAFLCLESFGLSLGGLPMGSSLFMQVKKVENWK